MAVLPCTEPPSKPQGRVTISPTDPERLFAFAPVLGAERSIVVQKTVWTAREVIDPATLEPTLIFFGTGVARRVRQYPGDWRNLPDDALYALSWSK